jgi:hypothetical protein
MILNHHTQKRSHLTMLGIIHRDRDAEGLLRERLAALGPDTITLEFSRYGLEYRKKNAPAMLEALNRTVRELRADGVSINPEALDRVLAYINPPAEYAAARDFAAAHGVPLLLVDMDRFSYLKLRGIGDLLAKDNLSKLLGAPHLTSGGHTEKALARLFFEKGVKVFAYTEEMRIRDGYMSAHLARLLARTGASHIVHICGWQHLCDPERLYEPLNPAKAFIHDKAVRI